MQAVISVLGKDAVGIIAKVSVGCAECGANIVDISQTVLHEYFTMIMLVEIDNLSITFSEFIDKMAELGKQNNLDIRAMHEDIFIAMHRI